MNTRTGTYGGRVPMGAGWTRVRIMNHGFWLVLTCIVLTYGSYLFFDAAVIDTLGKEDGLVENLTALCFLAASCCFLMAFLNTRNRYLLLLSVVFIVGCGEEISWGQRMFGYATPQPIAEINVQGEFNLHNIEWLNNHDLDGERKQGFAKLVTINFLYKIFWLTYGVLLPLAALTVPFIARLLNALRMPVPPLAMGILFPINWLVYRICLFLLPAGESKQYYDLAYESMEWISALVFMMIAIGFYRASRASSDVTRWRGP